MLIDADSGVQVKEIYNATRVITVKDHPDIGPTFNYSPNNGFITYDQSIAHYYFDILPFFLVGECAMIEKTIRIIFAGVGIACFGFLLTCFDWVLLLRYLVFTSKYNSAVLIIVGVSLTFSSGFLYVISVWISHKIIIKKLNISFFFEEMIIMLGTICYVFLIIEIFPVVADFLFPFQMKAQVDEEIGIIFFQWSSFIGAGVCMFMSAINMIKYSVNEKKDLIICSSIVFSGVIIFIALGFALQVLTFS